MAVIGAPQEGFLTLLKKRSFLRLWLAQLISMTILFASNYALLVLVEEVTGSTTLVGLAIISFSLPAVLLGGPAGVYVDRMDKRRVLWASNCLRAIATFAFVISLLLNRRQLIPVYLLTFLIASIGQFFTPAEGSSIPLLVSEDELMPALSLFNVTFMLAQALGFILFAPILLSFLPTFKLFSLTIDPVEMLYVIIAILYIVCAILIAFIPVEQFKSHKQAQQSRTNTQSLQVIGSVWGEMLDGWKFIRRNKRLFLAVIQLSFAGVLLLVIGELATPIVTHLLMRSPSQMAFVFAPAGIGLVIGSILMPRIARRLGKSRAIIIGCTSLAVTALLLPLTAMIFQAIMPKTWSTSPWLLLTIAVIMFFAGFALDFINIPAQTAMQEHTPEWIKGRVLSLQLVLYNAFSIPILFFIGGFADLFGLNTVLYLTSVFVALFGAWGIFYERRHPPIIPLEQPIEIEEKTEVNPVGS
jgi:MFS family permease